MTIDSFSGDIIALARLDMGVIGVYFIAVVAIGLMMSKRASRGISDYFLGGRTIPWWVIGASASASNLDMTGTMVIVSFFYAIGLQGFWVAMRGGIGLPLGFLMVFMGRWMQRSNVVTTAEWMALRFGRGPGGRAARLLSAVSNLVVTVGFVIYFCKGTGKFLSIFLPFSPETCAVLMVTVGLVYTAAAGLYGVVYTDLIQELLMVTTAVVIAYLAFVHPQHTQVLAAAGPAWIDLVPRWQAAPMPWLADPGVYQMFGLCIVTWITRGLLEGAGGFTGGYMPQRYYATASERDASLLTAEWIALLAFRWTMVVGLAFLGLALAQELPAVAQRLAADPEMTLPIVMGHVLPAGLRGVAVAGLVAAAMSTFDSTVNAGASYWVRDIYQEHINPRAAQPLLMRQSYLATVVISLAALAVALTIHNINEIWQWITGPLSAGLFAPIVLRWYWWRFNGEGFAVATGVGLVAAVGANVFFPAAPLYVSFPVTTLLSLVGGVVTSLATAPAAREVLTAFYQQIKPVGFWGPMRTDLGRGHADVMAQVREKWLALGNMPLAVCWHLSLFLLAIHFVLRLWDRIAVFGVVAALLSVALYFTWYRTLSSPQGSPYRRI